MTVTMITAAPVLLMVVYTYSFLLPLQNLACGIPETLQNQNPEPKTWYPKPLTAQHERDARVFLGIAAWPFWCRG